MVAIHFEMRFEIYFNIYIYVFIWKQTFQDVYTCDMLGNEDEVFAKKTLRSDILMFFKWIA